MIDVPDCPATTLRLGGFGDNVNGIVTVTVAEADIEAFTDASPR
jgi:hypothetical protein